MVAARIEGNTGERCAGRGREQGPGEQGVTRIEQAETQERQGRRALVETIEGASSTNSKTPVNALLPKRISAPLSTLS